MRISDWSSDVCSSDLGTCCEPLSARRGRPDCIPPYHPGGGRGPVTQRWTVLPHRSSLDPRLRGDDAKRNRPAEAGRTFASFPKPELRDQVQIALTIGGPEIVQQRATLVDEHQQAAARMVVLRDRKSTRLNSSH